MNLYLVVRTDDRTYDEYDSAVVCAENAQEAMTSCLNMFNEGFMNYTLLGVAEKTVPKGEILASFNAG